MTTIITISIAATFIICVWAGYELFNLKESINDLKNTIEESINLHNL